MSKKMDFSTRCSMVYPTEVLEKEPIGYPKVVQNVVDGRIVNSVEFVIDDPSTRNENIQFNDFALENLLASGVDLKEMKFNSMSLTAVDDFVNRIDEFKKSN